MSEVNEAITALKIELAKMPPSDHKERLEVLLQRLENEAETGNLSSVEVHGIVEQFQAEHPQLVQILNRIAVTLSDMGI
jgi:hypothetical protein